MLICGSFLYGNENQKNQLALGGNLEQCAKDAAAIAGILAIWNNNSFEEEEEEDFAYFFELCME